MPDCWQCVSLAWFPNHPVISFLMTKTFCLVILALAGSKSRPCPSTFEIFFPNIFTYVRDVLMGASLGTRLQETILNVVRVNGSFQLATIQYHADCATRMSVKNVLRWIPSYMVIFNHITCFQAYWYDSYWMPEWLAGYIFLFAPSI